MSTVLLPLALTILFILINGFFALAEYALIKVRPSRLQELARDGNHAAEKALFALGRINGYLAAVQLAVTMMSLLIGWIGEPTIARLIHALLPENSPLVSATITHTVSFVVAFSIITFFHISCGELIPKLVAIHHAERAVLATIYPLTAFYWFSYGPMWLVDRFAANVARLFGHHKPEDASLHSDEEIKIILDQREEAGKLSLDRLMMFENLFDFGESKVSDVMTPRAKIISLSAHADDRSANTAIIRHNHFSRYPLCGRGQSIDQTDRYVHVKDILDKCSIGEVPDLASIFKPLPTVFESMSLEACLALFQKNRWYIARAVDAAYRVTGIVTTEDLVEEIVGEIRDEFDDVPPLVLSQTIVRGTSLMHLAPDQSKFDAISKMLTSLHNVYPHFRLPDALKSVLAREKTLTTAIGLEAAIPHARIPDITRPLIVFAASKEGIDWSAPDGLPVKLLFCILTPSATPSAQVTILAALARVLSTASLKDRLIDATSEDDVWEVLVTAEEKVPD